MLKHLKNKLSGNKKNIVKISSGTLIGQVISVITLPIITRIYGVEVIGLWTLLNSIAMIIKSFSDLGMTNSIMIEDEKDIESTYKVITSIVAIISIVSAIIIIFYYIIFNRLNEINPIFLFCFVVFIIFTTQQIQVCYTWLNREGEYDVLMKNPLIQNGSYGICAILLGLLGMKAYGYFIGYMFGQGITLIHMKRKLPKRFFTRDIIVFKEVILRNKRFILYQMPTNLISNFKNQLPVLLLHVLWGTEMLGYYSMTVKLLQIPSTLLANAIGRVFFNITSAMKREGREIGQYVYKNLTSGMKIAIIPMVMLMAFGDVIAVVFLGSDWKIAGDFIRILALQYFFMFLMNTVQGLSITLEKQNYAMIFSVFQIIGYMFGALLGKYLFNNIYISLAFMSTMFILINIAYFSALFKVMCVSIRKYILNVVISIFIILIFSFLLRTTFENLGIIQLAYRIF